MGLNSTALTNCPRGLVFQFIRDPPLRRPTTILLFPVTDRYIKYIEKFSITAYRRSSIFLHGDTILRISLNKNVEKKKIIVLNNYSTYLKEIDKTILICK